MKKLLCIMLAFTIFFTFGVQLSATESDLASAAPSNAAASEQSSATGSADEPHLRENTVWDWISVGLIFAFCGAVIVLLIRYGKKWVNGK